MRNKNTQTRLKRLSPEQFMTAYGYDNIVARQWLHDFVRANNGWLWYGDKSTYTNGVLDLIGGEHTQPVQWDPTFDLPGTWTAGAGWEVTGGKGVCSSGSTNLYHGSVSITGCQYLTKFDVVNYTSGAVKGGLNSVTSLIERSALGTYTQSQIAGADSTFYFVSNNFVGAVDNLVIRNTSLINVPPKVGTGVLTQSTATAMPYGGDSGTAASPGRRIINFDGIADYIYDANTLPTLVSNNNNYTIFNVGNLNSIADGGTLYGFRNTNSYIGTVCISGTKWSLRRFYTPTNYQTNSVADANTNPHVFEEIYESGVQHRLYLDGSLSITDLTVTYPSVSFSYYSLGASMFSAVVANGFCAQQLKAHLIFPSVISAANRSTIRRILGAMNSITVTP